MDIWTNEEARQANDASRDCMIRELGEQMESLQERMELFVLEVQEKLKDYLPPEKKKEVDTWKEWVLYNNAFDAGYAKGYRDAKAKYADQGRVYVKVRTARSD